MSQLTGRQAGGVSPLAGVLVFLIYLALPMIEWGPCPWWRAICLPQGPMADADLVQKLSHSHTLNNVSPNGWAPRDPASWHIKVTVTHGDEGSNVSFHAHRTMQPAQTRSPFQIMFYPQNHALK